MSSISLTRRPMRNGARYSSTAAHTSVGRWVNVAQPTPVSPGTDVSTFTTTNLVPYGAVLIERMAVIVGTPSTPLTALLQPARCSPLPAGGPNIVAIERSLREQEPMAASKRLSCCTAGRLAYRVLDTAVVDAVRATTDYYLVVPAA